MQHPPISRHQRGGMFTTGNSPSRGLDSDKPNLIFYELVEYAHGITASAHTGEDRLRQSGFMCQNLLPCFSAYNRLEVPHHSRVGMGPRHRAEEIVGGVCSFHPDAEGLVDGVFQGAGSGGDGNDFGAQ